MRVIHLVGTPHQAAVLLLFNETGALEGAPPRPLAFGAVCRRLGMTRAEVSGVVLSLVASKVLDPLGGSSPGDYDMQSSLTLRAGLGLRSNSKPRPKIKLTSVESALQQLQHSAASASRSGASGQVGRVGNSRESEKQASGVSLSGMEDDAADADESLFDGGSPSIGGRQRHRSSPGGVGSSLQEERKQVLQAAIVRVLKTRKTCG